MESAHQPTPSNGLKDQAASLAHDATETLSTAVESVRARTGNLQAQLADALESGANVLRQRASAASPSERADASSVDGAGMSSGGATGRLEGVLQEVAPRIAAQGELAATVMERGAMWLRENDLSDLEGRVMAQVERHPVRTLGIAAAIGFLLARRGD